MVPDSLALERYNESTKALREIILQRPCFMLPIIHIRVLMSNTFVYDNTFFFVSDLWGSLSPPVDKLPQRSLSHTTPQSA